MLVDGFDRVIEYIRISITDRCNLRCKYCFDGTFNFIPHDEVLSYEEIIRFVRICAELGVGTIRLTGGEPLVRKGMCFLLREIGNIHGITDMSITTNGVLLGRKIQDLKESGLKRINISLDTLKREKFTFITGVDALHEVLTGIEKAVHAGLNPIKINTVVIKGFNDGEILDFAKLAKDHDYHVRFIEYMPFGDSNLWKTVETITSREIEERIRSLYDLEPAAATKGPAKMFNMKAGSGKIGFISPVSGHICAGCNRIRLKSNGMIRPCLFSDAEYDIKKLLRGGKTDEEIMDAVKEIVRVKPERRQEFARIRKCRKGMRHIGG